MEEKTMTFRFGSACTMAFAGLLAAAGAHADEGGWQYELTPYLWASAMKGETKVFPHVPKVKVDSSFSDILDSLDMGFMGAFEARKGRWGILVDAIYMNVSDAATAVRTGPEDAAVLATANANLRAKQAMVGVGAAYRFSEGPTAVDAIGGLRYSHISVEARIDATFFGAAGTAIRKSTEDWVDPYVGMRVQHPITPRWTLVGYADIGGFGVGSDFTWQAAAGANYALSRDVTAKFGYRYMSVDYDKGGFMYDVANSGLYAGVGIRF
jgi:opacity protein-like surface antigen